MPCYSPLKGWRSRATGESGKRAMVFTPDEAYTDLPLSVPCGQCIGCRLERSRQWAIRIMHEAQQHTENCFITLTYDGNTLPENGSLIKSDFQNFMKRLRKTLHPKKIRFFHCGEYGENFKRPHYHCAVFGHNFAHKKYDKDNDLINYGDEILNKTWEKGFTKVGELNFDSAAYIARYITKKVNGIKADTHYGNVNKTTGEITPARLPEYITMSRRPGIGKAYLDKYLKEIYTTDSIIIKGREMLPPKYYDRQYELIDEGAIRKIKSKRVSKVNKADNTDERLRIKEICALAKLKTKKRGYENEDTNIRNL